MFFRVPARARSVKTRRRQGGQGETGKQAA